MIFRYGKDQNLQNPRKLYLYEYYRYNIEKKEANPEINT